MNVAKILLTIVGISLVCTQAMAAKPLSKQAFDTRSYTVAPDVTQKIFKQARLNGGGCVETKVQEEAPMPTEKSIVITIDRRHLLTGIACVPHELEYL